MDHEEPSTLSYQLFSWVVLICFAWAADSLFPVLRVNPPQDYQGRSSNNHQDNGGEEEIDQNPIPRSEQQVEVVVTRNLTNVSCDSSISSSDEEEDEDEDDMNSSKPQAGESRLQAKRRKLAQQRKVFETRMADAKAGTTTFSSSTTPVTSAPIPTASDPAAVALTSPRSSSSSSFHEQGPEDAPVSPIHNASAKTSHISLEERRKKLAEKRRAFETRDHTVNTTRSGGSQEEEGHDNSYSSSPHRGIATTSSTSTTSPRSLSSRSRHKVVAYPDGVLDSATAAAVTNLNSNLIGIVSSSSSLSSSVPTTPQPQGGVGPTRGKPQESHYHPHQHKKEAPPMMPDASSVSSSVLSTTSSTARGGSLADRRRAFEKSTTTTTPTPVPIASPTTPRGGKKVVVVRGKEASVSDRDEHDNDGAEQQQAQHQSLDHQEDGVEGDGTCPQSPAVSQRIAMFESPRQQGTNSKSSKLSSVSPGLKSVMSSNSYDSNSSSNNNNGNELEKVKLKPVLRQTPESQRNDPTAVSSSSSTVPSWRKSKIPPPKAHSPARLQNHPTNSTGTAPAVGRAVVVQPPATATNTTARSFTVSSSSPSAAVVMRSSYSPSPLNNNIMMARSSPSKLQYPKAHAPSSMHRKVVVTQADNDKDLVEHRHVLPNKPQEETAAAPAAAVPSNPLEATLLQARSGLSPTPSKNKVVRIKNDNTNNEEDHYQQPAGGLAKKIKEEPSSSSSSEVGEETSLQRKRRELAEQRKAFETKMDQARSKNYSHNTGQNNASELESVQLKPVVRPPEQTLSDSWSGKVLGVGLQVVALPNNDNGEKEEDPESETVARSLVFDVDDYDDDRKLQPIGPDTTATATSIGATTQDTARLEATYLQARSGLAPTKRVPDNDERMEKTSEIVIETPLQRKRRELAEQRNAFESKMEQARSRTTTPAAETIMSESQEERQPSGSPPTQADESNKEGKPSSVQAEAELEVQESSSSAFESPVSRKKRLQMELEKSGEESSNALEATLLQVKSGLTPGKPVPKAAKTSLLQKKDQEEEPQDAPFEMNVQEKQENKATLESEQNLEAQSQAKAEKEKDLEDQELDREQELVDEEQRPAQFENNVQEEQGNETPMDGDIKATSQAKTQEEKELEDEELERERQLLREEEQRPVQVENTVEVEKGSETALQLENNLEAQSLAKSEEEKELEDREIERERVLLEQEQRPVEVEKNAQDKQGNETGLEHERRELVETERKLEAQNEAEAAFEQELEEAELERERKLLEELAATEKEEAEARMQSSSTRLSPTVPKDVFNEGQDDEGFNGNASKDSKAEMDNEEARATTTPITTTADKATIYSAMVGAKDTAEATTAPLNTDVFEPLQDEEDIAALEQEAAMELENETPLQRNRRLLLEQRKDHAREVEAQRLAEAQLESELEATEVKREQELLEALARGEPDVRCAPEAAAVQVTEDRETERNRELLEDLARSEQKEAYGSPPPSRPSADSTLLKGSSTAAEESSNEEPGVPAPDKDSENEFDNETPLQRKRRLLAEQRQDFETKMAQARSLPGPPESEPDHTVVIAPGEETQSIVATKEEDDVDVESGANLDEEEEEDPIVDETPLERKRRELAERKRKLEARSQAKAQEEKELEEREMEKERQRLEEIANREREDEEARQAAAARAAAPVPPPPPPSSRSWFTIQKQEEQEDQEEGFSWNAWKDSNDDMYNEDQITTKTTIATDSADELLKNPFTPDTARIDEVGDSKEDGSNEPEENQEEGEPIVEETPLQRKRRLLAEQRKDFETKMAQARSSTADDTVLSTTAPSLDCDEVEESPALEEPHLIEPSHDSKDENEPGENHVEQEEEEPLVEETPLQRKRRLLAEQRKDFEVKMEKARSATADGDSAVPTTAPSPASDEVEESPTSEEPHLMKPTVDSKDEEEPGENQVEAEENEPIVEETPLQRKRRLLAEQRKDFEVKMEKARSATADSDSAVPTTAPSTARDEVEESPTSEEPQLMKPTGGDSEDEEEPGENQVEAEENEPIVEETPLQRKRRLLAEQRKDFEGKMEKARSATVGDSAVPMTAPSPASDGLEASPTSEESQLIEPTGADSKDEEEPEDNQEEEEPIVDETPLERKRRELAERKRKLEARSQAKAQEEKELEEREMEKERQRLEEIANREREDEEACQAAAARAAAPVPPPPPPSSRSWFTIQKQEEQEDQEEGFSWNAWKDSNDDMYNEDQITTKTTIATDSADELLKNPFTPDTARIDEVGDSREDGSNEPEENQEEGEPIVEETPLQRKRRLLAEQRKDFETKMAQARSPTADGTLVPPTASSPRSQETHGLIEERETREEESKQEEEVGKTEADPAVHINVEGDESVSKLSKEVDGLASALWQYETELEEACRSLLRHAAADTPILGEDDEMKVANEEWAEHDDFSKVYQHLTEQPWFQRLSSTSAHLDGTETTLELDIVASDPSIVEDREREYRVTALGQSFLQIDGPAEADISIFLHSFDGENAPESTAAFIAMSLSALEHRWSQVARIANTAQSKRILENVEELLIFALNAKLIS